MSDDEGFLKRLARRVMDLKDRAVEYPSALVPQATEQQKLQNDIAVAQARNAVDRFAVPKAAWAMENVPGMSELATIMASDKPRPEARQPIQQEREFSNDQDRDEYIAKVREAVAKAKEPKAQ